MCNYRYLCKISFKRDYLLHGGVPERGHTLILPVVVCEVLSNSILQILKKLISLRRWTIIGTYLLILTTAAELI